MPLFPPNPHSIHPLHKAFYSYHNTKGSLLPEVLGHIWCMLKFKGFSELWEYRCRWSYHSLTELLFSFHYCFHRDHVSSFLLECKHLHSCDADAFICVSSVLSCCYSVTQSCPALWPHGQQHSRLPCPSLSLGACSYSRPLSQWCHPTISCSVIPLFSCLQSFPVLGSFPVSHFFTSGGQSIGASVSASVFPMNIQDWFPLGWTGSFQWIFRTDFL